MQAVRNVLQSVGPSRVGENSPAKGLKALYRSSYSACLIFYSQMHPLGGELVLPRVRVCRSFFWRQSLAHHIPYGARLVPSSASSLDTNPKCLRTKMPRATQAPNLPTHPGSSLSQLEEQLESSLLTNFDAVSKCCSGSVGVCCQSIV